MSPRLLICDVDGTLVRDDKSLSDTVITAVARLMDAGIGMSLISARPPSGILPIAERLRLTLPIGAFNGGTILRPDGETVSATRLPRDIARRALSAIAIPQVTIWLFKEGRWHAGSDDPLHAPRERKATNQEPIIGGDLTTLIDAVDKIVAVSDDHPLLERLEAQVAADLGNAATVARSQPYYLDITAPAANKGDGVIALAQAARVPIADVAVIGDQRNDIAMFQRAGLSFAMGQAPDAVKHAATRVTASNADDGVALAIDTILTEARCS